MKATVGTRVVLLQGRVGEAGRVGVIIEERLEPYLKRYVVQCDDGRICFASPSEVALESDPAAAPLGPPTHD
jgi:hypothetical protein